MTSPSPTDYTISVDAPTRAYSVFVGPQSLGQLHKFLHARAGRVAVVADAHVWSLHGPRLRQVLPPAAALTTFPQGESSKSLAVAERLFEELARARLGRDGCIVAFGGGVATDMGGFLAALWQRGVDVTHVPTTLEAAIDAALGGKTAVNLAAGKNLVGVFHQPAGVFVDPAFQATLPPREVAAGLAESVKHAVIRDVDFLDWQEARAAQILALDGPIMSELIARNCRIKADVVARDEREAGLREMLNHGHTIGHALETVLGYTLRHGECVALGMIAENAISVARGWLTETDAGRVASLLRRFGLPTRLGQTIATATVVDACRRDKKNRAGEVRCSLLTRLGEAGRAVPITESEIGCGLAALA